MLLKFIIAWVGSCLLLGLGGWIGFGIGYRAGRDGYRQEKEKP